MRAFIRRILLLAAMLAAGLPAARALVADRSDSKLLLEVLINGRDTHKLADFVERGGGHGAGRDASRKAVLYATRADLRDLGLRLPRRAGHPDDELVRLSSLPGITYKLDGPTQTIEIKAADSALIATSLDGQAGPKLPPVRTGSGVLLNYDATELYTDHRFVWRSELDGRAFFVGGVLNSQFLLSAGDGPSAIRLDSTLSYADPDTLRSYQAGDVINGGLAWTRPVRLGGLQVQSDFAIRPDLVTFPTPQIGGSAAVPSTVDVLVNNVRLLSRNVDSGPFTLNQLPIVTGANTVTVVTRDALGQQTTQTLPFYTTPRLLLPGLAAYSAEFGAIRSGYGLQSNNYSRPAGSVTARYGLFRLLTVEAHAEVSSSLALAGAGAAVNLGNLGVLTASAAGSSHGRHQGLQFSAGIERVTRLLTFSASYQRASTTYADLASVAGTPVPQQELHFGAGLSLGRAGSFNLVYAAIDTRISAFDRDSLGEAALDSGQDIDASMPVQAQAARTSLLSLTYTARIWGNIQGYVTGFHDFARADGSGAVISLSVPLGRRRSASITAGSAGRESYLTEQASQAAVIPGEIGGTMLNQNGAPDRQMLQLDTVTRFGDFDAGVDRIGRTSAFRIGQSGSFALLDGGVFAGRTIQDSFAVVDTGMPHVQVLQENRPAGTTGQDGKLLLPNLQSFANNRIDLDPASIPTDTDMRSVSQIVRPQALTGIVVNFALRRRASATMHLVDEKGALLPVGSIAVLASGGPPNLVGYDGTAFIRDLKAHNRVLVTRPDGKRCSLEFAFRKSGDARPDLGTLTCHMQGSQ